MPSPRASTAWSAEQDDLLKLNRARSLGWKAIAELFDGKTGNACRKRHERLMEKKNLDDWNPKKTEDLARGYMELRQAMWSTLAQRVREDWKTVEQKVGLSPARTPDHPGPLTSVRETVLRRGPQEHAGHGAEVGPATAQTLPAQELSGPAPRPPTSERRSSTSRRALTVHTVHIASDRVQRQRHDIGHDRILSIPRRHLHTEHAMSGWQRR